jgi:regulator of protease activity HflC (stomatin/prohibitin superfamily)
VSEFFNWLMGFVREFKFLAIVLPWERAIRVRLGSRVMIWEPGWHIRLPFIDDIQVLNTRLRIADAGGQTLTTADGHTLTLSVTIGFAIIDPELAMLRLHHPESACGCLAASVVAELVSETDRAALRPVDIEAHVLKKLQEESGYEFEFVRVTDFAFARTFRLLNDNGYQRGLPIEERKL